MHWKIAKTLAFLFLFTGAAATASAQALTGEEIKTTFVNEWERAKAYTQEYLNAMPADKYSAKAVDSIRSFAQQMLHLASANVGLIGAATGEKPVGFPGRGLENSPTAQTKDSVEYYVNASYDFAIQSIKKVDLNKLGETIHMGNLPPVTRYAMLLKAFEHQTHHRGQATIYIRLQGIRPPQEKLF
ncbi:MAG TPA: DinB family protein [Puia sp.]|uniref:DinB family protein n=1 Tax=Puia sp. TaxID=2045100 RepID=UPI002BE5DC21|nr:DinB family protein [Puia sp.]HVU95799.1 DinB family protein [Puia sp.]